MKTRSLLLNFEYFCIVFRALVQESTVTDGDEVVNKTQLNWRLIHISLVKFVFSY
jgi:hypothetical protein